MYLFLCIIAKIGSVLFLVFFKICLKALVKYENEVALSGMSARSNVNALSAKIFYHTGALGIDGFQRLFGNDIYVGNISKECLLTIVKVHYVFLVSVLVLFVREYLFVY